MPEKVFAAVEAWNNAPLHIRTMAGAYVTPMIEAMVAIADEIEKLKAAKTQYFPNVPHRGSIL